MGRKTRGHAYGHVGHFRIPRLLVDRDSYILEHCRGRRVLHVGFIDYVRTGDWTETIRGESWLHGRIKDVAAEVIGIDIAAEAITLLREVYGMDGMYYCDAQDLSTLGKGTFDVIVAGEVLEHLPCPGNFLRSAYPILRDAGSLIITTTNAFCARKSLQILFNHESIHEDHVSYFSHRTLQRLAELYNYRVVEQCSYRITGSRPLLPYIAERLACILSPNLGEGIICCMGKETKEHLADSA